MPRKERNRSKSRKNLFARKGLIRKGSSSKKRSSPFADFSLPTNSTEMTISSPRKPTSASSSSIPETAQQQATIQKMTLQSRNEVMQTLSQTPRNLKELHLEGISLDDELFWLLVKSNLEWLCLRNCVLDSNSSTAVTPILEFLKYGRPLNPPFRFAVQFNNRTTQCIECTGSHGLELTRNGPISSLLSILSEDTLQKPFLGDICSLIVAPLKSNSMRPLSVQHKQNLRSILGHEYPNLKHLLLKDLNSNDDITNYIPLLEMKLDLIYLWNCRIKTDNPFWFFLLSSASIVSSIHPGKKVQSFRFAVPIKGHITQIVNHRTPSFLNPSSYNIGHGLILFLGQEIPSDILSDSISFLALLPSKRRSMKTLSPKLMQSLKPLITHQSQNLKYLLLKDMAVDDKVDDFISISQLKLDLIYIWNCYPRMINIIWSLLDYSMHLIHSMQAEWVQAFQFAIRENGHTTQIVCNQILSFVKPHSPYLPYGLILMLSDAITIDIQLDKISFVALLPSGIDVKKPLSPQSKSCMKSTMSLQWPKLKYLLLKWIEFDDNIGDFIFNLQPKLDLIYLWDCGFVADNLIGSTLLHSLDLINSLYTEKVWGLQIAFPINGHITQIVCNNGSSFLMPNSPEMVHGLILNPGHKPSDDLLLDDISFIAFHPSQRAIKEVLSDQSKQTLKYLMDRLHPKLKYILLMYMDFGNNIEDYISISHFKLDLIYIWASVFKTSNFIWSKICDSAKLLASISPRKFACSQFDIPINGHTTQIICNYTSSFWSPNSPNMDYGLILSLEQHLPDDLLLDDISLLTFFPSEADLKKPISPSCKQNLMSVMSLKYPDLKYLLLIGINFDDNIEKFIQISQPKLDLIYNWGCSFRTNDLIWSSICKSMNLLVLLCPKTPNCFRFAIPTNGHTTQIICNYTSSFLLPNSPELLHGLILTLGQDLPADLPLDNISFLIFLPSGVNPLQQSSAQLEQIVSSIKRKCPNLIHLFSKSVSLSEMEGILGPMLQVEGLDAYIFC